MRLVTIILFCFSLISVIGQDTIKVTYYNLLDFPERQEDRVDTLKKILDYIQPDVFVVNELTSQYGGDIIKNIALNVNGDTSFASAVFDDGPDTDNLLFYDQTKLGFYSQNKIVTTLRDINEYILYHKSSDLSVTNDTTLMYFYSLHLKAGNTISDGIRRNDDAVIFKQYLVNNNLDNRIFIGGDFNFYDSQEQACQQILNGQGLTLIDPINQMGSWHTNDFYEDYHTQSTRSATGGYAGGAWGGMDDRFDFIFVSEDVMDASGGVKYLENTYVAEGQDGSFYNQAINMSSNAAVPNDIARALFYMSDHLPVSLKFAVGSPIGINNLDKEEIHFLYNPIIKRLNIYCDEKDVEFTLYDIRGSKIMSEIVNYKTDFFVDLGAVKKGFYIISCALNGEIITHKFVVY